MSTCCTETVPDTWDEARDVPFFRITCRLFSPRFCLAASTLLAADDDPDLVPAAAGAQRSAPAVPA